MKIDQSLNVCRMTLVELLWTLIHVCLHAFMRIEQALHPNVVTQLLHNSCSFDCAHEFVNNTFIQIWWLKSHTTLCSFDHAQEMWTPLSSKSGDSTLIQLMLVWPRTWDVNTTFIQIWWLNSYTTHARLTAHMSSWTTLSSNSGDSTLIQLILVWLHTWVREQHFHPILVSQLSYNSYSFDCTHEFVNNTFIQIWWLNSHITLYARLTKHMSSWTTRSSKSGDSTLIQLMLVWPRTWDVNTTIIQIWILN